MELIKALPEIFEDFAEQRKNSFLTMKELKDKNVPVIGAFSRRRLRWLWERLQ